MFGLPPCCIILAHDLKDGALLEGQSSLLTRDSFVVFWVVVKECPHKHLEIQERVEREEKQRAGVKAQQEKATVHCKLPFPPLHEV